MAVIGSRANGTRVPKGGGFGPASDIPQNGFFNPDAPQPASERRDVTFLGRPALPAAPDPARATGSGSGLGFEANSLADTDLPPLDARSDLFVKSTADRIRREWFDTVAQDERALDPLAATGFAGGIKQRFEDFTAKTLGDMPETLRPHIADSLVRVGREIETRAADFETTASPVGVFNQTKQALDDLTATTAHERFDAHHLLIEGQKRIQDAPLNEGAKDILRGYFLADLPVKTAQSHIDDDPDDALAALEAAEYRNGGSGKAKEGGASAKAPSPGSLADGGDGEFDPALFYVDIAPEVRSGLKAKARVTSARRRESARIEITKNLEQGIAANTVTAAQIETANLETDDKVRLHAQLKTARAEDERDAEAAERYITDPKSFDRDNPIDRAVADRGFGALAGETDNPASALSVGPDGEAIDVIGLAGKFAFHSRFMPPAAVKRLRRIVDEGTPEDSERAAAMLDEFSIPLSEAPVLPEAADKADVRAAPSSFQPVSEVQADASTPTPVEEPEAVPEGSIQDVGALEEAVGEEGTGDTEPTPGENADVVLDDELIANIRNSLKDPEAFQSKFQRAVDVSQLLLVPLRALGQFGSLYVDGPVIVGKDAEGSQVTLVDQLGRSLHFNPFSNKYFFANPSDPGDLTVIETANDLAGSISPSGLALRAKVPKGALTMGAAGRGSGGGGKSADLPSSAERASKMEAVEVGQDEDNVLALVHPSDARPYPDVGTTIILDRPVMMSKEVAQRGYPLGFDSADEFLAYKKGLLDALPAQHGGAIVGMRGSSIHGKKFKRFDDPPDKVLTSDNKVQGAHTGPFFDTGKEPSDWDIFIVSPELFRIAKEKRFLRKDTDKSSGPIGTAYKFRRLGMEEFGHAIRGNGERKSSVMIFESLDGLRRRGSYMQFD